MILRHLAPSREANMDHMDSIIYSQSMVKAWGWKGEAHPKAKTMHTQGAGERQYNHLSTPVSLSAVIAMTHERLSIPILES